MEVGDGGGAPGWEVGAEPLLGIGVQEDTGILREGVLPSHSYIPCMSPFEARDLEDGPEGAGRVVLSLSVLVFPATPFTEGPAEHFEGLM